ncbi:flavoprotein [Actinoplanes oblitus]|uniref:Flavoprotein n=1 Tax=Actinoplanes oblitus TaxID=3040509 RepID=A0ABY8WG32_9ACTN|nr:flavoprotein [Actinoplanes oblitus]WIM96427.1 flavoprotein [Actinoplanes oblitus]
MLTAEQFSAKARALKVVIGVCGSVSAVAVPHLAMWLKASLEITNVDIIVTAAARELIGLPILEASIDGRVVTDWRTSADDRVTHVTIAERADLVVVLPATANFLAKAAHGIADDILTTTILAVTCPVVIVPVMNEAMWKNKAVQRNVATLRDDGYDVVPPKAGLSLATGRWELGSMGDFRPIVVAALTKALSAPGTTLTE